MKWLFLGLIAGALSVLTGCFGMNGRVCIGAEDYGTTASHNVSTKQGVGDVK